MIKLRIGLNTFRLFPTICLLFLLDFYTEPGEPYLQDNFFKMVVPPLVGTFQFDSADNIDEYLKGLGVGLVLRKVQTVAKPTYTIAYNEQTKHWTVSTESVFKAKQISFGSSDKFEDETYDARNCQTSVEVLEDGKMMKMTQICEEGPNVETIITATETGFTMAMKSGELACEIKSVRASIQNQDAPAVVPQ